MHKRRVREHHGGYDSHLWDHDITFRLPAHTVATCGMLGLCNEATAISHAVRFGPLCSLIRDLIAPQILRYPVAHCTPHIYVCA